LIKVIKTPLFIIQSPYDSWSIPNILGIECTKDGTLKTCTDEEKDEIKKFRDNHNNLALATL